MSYDAMCAELAQALVDNATPGLNVVLIDGIPAGGKSSLTAQVAKCCEELGRSTATIENDWFIGRSIRNPVSILNGLRLALSGRSTDEVEQRLLDHFLDSQRLSAFQRELHHARRFVDDGEVVTLWPQGAFWNLQRPRPWSEIDASRGLRVGPGDIVLIEGTLTRAIYEGFEELTQVLVTLPPDIARHRFLQRNRDRSRRRNLAFSALAKNGRAFHLASEMIQRHRDRYDYEVDLESLERPELVRCIRP